ncbi:DUF4386 domain-containing protein [Rossellomorea oryzaecorticis]|uniref:DUF4386 domain-containing protein n=1 Tax=Rossellomorea oryzaecorticis TaxID=1396505 RepID=A0ABU9KB46_9BACI
MGTSKVLNRQQKAAIISGAALLIMTIAAFFLYGYVHSSIVSDGDDIATLKNIQTSGSLFELEILGWIVIILMDLLVSWGFYMFLKPFHQKYASVSGWLRLLYTFMLGTAVSHLIFANKTASEALFSESADMAASSVMSSFKSFESVWSMGLIIFGLHLITAGFAAWKSKQIPKLISSLVMAAGFSYTLVHIMYRFMPQVERLTVVVESILLLPMFIGELGFAIWLLVKGRKLSSAN